MSFRAVFSCPPGSASFNELNDWYDTHLGEILAYPGFVAARRYDVTPLGGWGCPAAYPFASLYVMSGHPEETNAVVRAAVEAGEVVHPGWFPLPRSSWSFYPISGPAVATLADEMTMVMASSPVSMGVSDGAEWYRSTVGPILDPQLGDPRLLQMVASSVNAEAPSTADILGLYEAPLRTLVIPAEVADRIVAVGLRASGPARMA